MLQCMVCTHVLAAMCMQYSNIGARGKSFGREIVSGGSVLFQKSPEVISSDFCGIHYSWPRCTGQINLVLVFLWEAMATAPLPRVTLHHRKSAPGDIKTVTLADTRTLWSLSTRLSLIQDKLDCPDEVLAPGILQRKAWITSAVLSNALHTQTVPAVYSASSSIVHSLNTGVYRIYRPSKKPRRSRGFLRRL